jgi:hypothetical protein
MYANERGWDVGMCDVGCELVRWCVRSLVDGRVIGERQGHGTRRRRGYGGRGHAFAQVASAGAAQPTPKRFGGRGMEYPMMKGRGNR